VTYPSLTLVISGEKSQQQVQQVLHQWSTLQHNTLDDEYHVIYHSCDCQTAGISRQWISSPHTMRPLI